LDEQHERRRLVDERPDRRADAEELLRVVDADTSFRATTRMPDRTNDLQRAETRGAGVVKDDFGSWDAGPAEYEDTALVVRAGAGRRE
jgi:hypothetical protein